MLYWLIVEISTKEGYAHEQNGKESPLKLPTIGLDLLIHLKDTGDHKSAANEELTSFPNILEIRTASSKSYQVLYLFDQIGKRWDLSVGWVFMFLGLIMLN